jgi:hypothetical protein
VTAEFRDVTAVPFPPQENTTNNLSLTDVNNLNTEMETGDEHIIITCLEEIGESGVYIYIENAISDRVIEILEV